MEKTTSEGKLQENRGAYNLRKIQGVIANGIENQVLQFVDNSQEIFPERRHGHGPGQQAAHSAIRFEME